MKPSRCPEATEWITGLKETFYPRRCRKCYKFPMIRIQWKDKSCKTPLYTCLWCGNTDLDRD